MRGGKNNEKGGREGGGNEDIQKRGKGRKDGKYIKGKEKKREKG